MERNLFTGYMQQLDGVRAIAAGMVIFSHFAPPSPVHDALNWGYVGVRLFFVLSGFLITGILLEARPEDHRGRTSVLRSFYARRALRILPVYYLTLAVVATVEHDFDSAQFVSYLTYTANWFICWRSQVGLTAEPLVAGHFWSLAVEEQFYLIWPWLILYLPRRWLLSAILAAVALAPALRLGLVAQRYTVISITFNTFGCLDTLGAGALLGYARWAWGRAAAGRLARWAGRASVPLLFLGVPTGWWPRHYVVWFTLQDVFWGCLFLWLVWAAADEATGVAGRVLAATPVVYLGRISYGIYVYHGFAGGTVPWLFEAVGLPYPDDGYLRAAVLAMYSVAVASLSWHLIEAPINALKRYFPYPSNALAQPGPVNRVLAAANE